MALNPRARFFAFFTALYRPKPAPAALDVAVVKRHYEAARSEVTAIEKQARFLRGQLKDLNNRGAVLSGKCSALKALLTELEESETPGI